MILASVLLVATHPLVGYYTYGKENIISSISHDFAHYENKEITISKKSQSIIEWQKNQLNFPNSKRFDNKYLNYYYLRIFLLNEPLYYIHINRASCGELALIFEYLAEEMDVQYRSLIIDGHINQRNMNIDNHRWTEVLLEDNTWGIVDVGFNFSPISHDKYEFTENRSLLFGHVVYQNENRNWNDVTPDYVRNTTKLRINVTNNDYPVKNAKIDVFLNYNNKSAPVIGRHITYHTNESGLVEFHLGIYENVTYNIEASKYFWGKEVLYMPNEINNSLDINLDSSVLNIFCN
ncbi:hypothetical protein Mzhil_1436 [Methanosalsum zhilinae DSM 4017]|uniref:Transglutaminase-like domain-containing protein n=1 Tax=Methanosalsum zhilinae (strain DSM 4017 / NBRC 107636 / OCM 62 / WeN5) TaxID=679901 RepID=F7XNS9_METZD|nr:hypothetical protein [Methanosalsum zhilinae]AEH61280.1 hypothetical protein Mzhil_1436 [Methanosalsum zhilinae DSM 4017]